MNLPLDQVKVVDADTHMTERHDLWTSRAPAKYKDRMPHVEQIDGATQWVVERDVVLGRAGAGGVVDMHGNKGRSFEGLFEWEIEQGHRAGWDLDARMQLLDEIGIWAQIVFPGVVGLGGQNLGDLVTDVALRNLCLEIFNDANAEMQAASGNRLLPMAILPAWDIDACVREVERAKTLGLRGVNLTSDPQDLGSPDLANRAWDPVWEACAGLEMPVHFHIGASLTTMNFFGNYPWESHDDDTKLAIGGALLFIGNAPRRRQPHLLGHVRPVPRAQGRVGRERHGLGAVHPRGARLRDGRERPRRQGADEAAAVGVLQAEHLRHDLVRAPQPGAADRLRRRGQHHVRDRLPAPDVPVPGAVEDRRGEPRRAEHRGAATRSWARTPRSSTGSSQAESRRPGWSPGSPRGFEGRRS